MPADNVLPFTPGHARDQAKRALHRAPEPLWREVVGRELRWRRQDVGRTLADVAHEAGVSTQYLSEIERGLKEPSSEILRAVNGALGLRLIDLAGDVNRTLGRMSGPVCLAA